VNEVQEFEVEIGHVVRKAGMGRNIIIGFFTI